MKCPNCGRDITVNLFEEDPSQVNGFIDIGYDCEDCGISVYTFKVETLIEDEADDE